MKYQISIHFLLLDILIQLFNIIYCEQHNEIQKVLPLTIFFSGCFGDFKRYEENFKYLNNTISIICDSDTRMDNSKARNDFKLQLLDSYSDSFEIDTSEDLDKFFMYQKRLNLTLESNAKKVLSVNIPEKSYYDNYTKTYVWPHEYKRTIQKITLQVNNWKNHPFDVVLLSSGYYQGLYNQPKGSRLLERLYNATRKIIEELKEPSIIILSDLLLIDDFPQWLKTSFNRSGSNWKICSHYNRISRIFDSIMFYAHSIPQYTLEINITNCKNLDSFTQLADILVTYKIKETTTNASTTLRTTTKATTTTTTASTKSSLTKSKTTSFFSTISPTIITEIILNTKTATLTLNEQFEYRDDFESNMSTILANDEFEDDNINGDKCEKISENEGIANSSCVERANIVKVAFCIITSCCCFFAIRK